MNQSLAAGDHVHGVHLDGEPRAVRARQDADLAASPTDLSKLSTRRVGLVDWKSADWKYTDWMCTDRMYADWKCTDWMSPGSPPIGSTPIGSSPIGCPRWKSADWMFTDWMSPMEVRRLEVHSVLSLQLVTPLGLLGALTVYASARHAVDAHAEVSGKFVRDASVGHSAQRSELGAEPAAGHAPAGG